MKKIIYCIICILTLSCKNQKSEADLKLIPIKTDNYWGFIDKEGVVKINPQFSRANPFVEGLALVQSTDGKYGYIGEDGKYVINSQYKDATDFSNGLALTVKENGKLEYINSKGEVKITLDAGADYSTKFNSGSALVFSGNPNGFCSVIGTDGKEIFPTKYKLQSLFHEGLAVVSNYDSVNKKESYGFINEKGELIIPFQFEKVYDFHSGLARFRSGGKYGFIDKAGKFVINPQFDDVYDFENDLAVIKQGTLYGYIDTKGKTVINPQYKDANSFYSDLASVTATDGKVGFIDSKGTYVINPQFESASRFYGDIAIIRMAGKYGIINKKGNITVNPRFDNVTTEIREDSYVRNDFFDSKDVVDFLTELINDKTFSKTSTFQDVKNVYPNLTQNNYTSFTEFNKKSRFIGLERMSMYFAGLLTYNPSYSPTKVYDPVSGGYITQNVQSGSSETLNPSAKITTISLECHLLQKARDKKDDILKAFYEKLKSLNFKVDNESISTGMFSNGNFTLRVYGSGNEISLSFNYENLTENIKDLGGM